MLYSAAKYIVMMIRWGAVIPPPAHVWTDETFVAWTDEFLVEWTDS